MDSSVARDVPAVPGAGPLRRRLGIGARNSYRHWGLLGYGFGAAVLLLTAQLSQRGLLLGLVVIASCVASFGIAVKLSFIIFGAERIVFFQQTLAALGLAAAVLALTDRPLRAGLDLAIIGIGAFLSFGRVGCLSAGCCYGRPARRGVRYPLAMHTTGFPRHLCEVTLWPIQLVEAALSLLLVGAAITVVLVGWAPGSAVAVYLVGYGFARLGLELARGDEARPTGLGLSEAQWTAPLVAWLLAWRGGGWLVWAATLGANPAVSARVDSFQVVSDAQVVVVVTIERPDPSIAVQCLVHAQAVSFERVGEVPLTVPAGTEVSTRLEVTVRTFKAATTASIEGCRAIG